MYTFINSRMNYMMNRLTALFLVLILFCAPVASAQTTDVGEQTSAEPNSSVVVDATPSETVAGETLEPVTDSITVSETTASPVVEEATSAPSEMPQPQSGTGADVVQETASSTQATASADVLEGTANPEADAPTEGVVIPVEEATTTDEVVQDVIVLDEQPPILAAEEIPVAAQTDLTVVATDMQIVREEQKTNAELNALIEPDFVMSLSGNIVPTKRKPGDSTESVTASVDPERKMINVSGTCSDTYYVVLLYRNATDYDADPASYILNRAYPCVDGTYDYAIADLPTSVQNGTYYLLIGEQGERGSWRPATALTEVVINRSN